MKVAIITEGYQGTGYGHLTRCLSIYQAFEEKGIVPLYIANCDEEGKKFIPNVNLLQMNWLEKSEELIETINVFDIAVIDSYLAPKELYVRIYKTVRKVVYIDDYIRLDYPPGVIVNGTIGAEHLPYKKDDEHEYLLGIDYMPLRKEFWDVEVPKRKNKIENLLITFGAQDIMNLTKEVLSFLVGKFPKLKYHVVTRNCFDLTFNQNKTQINYYYYLNASEMRYLMLNSDIAVSAGGQTTYELYQMKLPFFAIGAETNQKYNLQGWKNIGIIKDEIWYNDTNLFHKLTNFIQNIDFTIYENKKSIKFHNNIYV